MYSAILQTHKISVILFLLLYLVKTILLLANKKEALSKVSKGMRVPEMIISTLFLLSGIYLLINAPEIKTLLIIKIVAVLASIPVAIIAYKKQNKTLAVLSLLLIIAAYGMAEMAKKPAVKTAAAEVDGQKIFMDNCALCHGHDGKAGINGASDLSASLLDHDGIVAVVANGRGVMASFKRVLTQEQIDAVAKHTEALKK